MPSAVTDSECSDEEIPMELDLTANGPPRDDDECSTDKTPRTNSVVARVNKVMFSLHDFLRAHKIRPTHL